MNGDEKNNDENCDNNDDNNDNDNNDDDDDDDNEDYEIPTNPNDLKEFIKNIITEKQELQEKVYNLQDLNNKLVFFLLLY